jgi:uncharacterized iron-regulated membrane protein
MANKKNSYTFRKFINDAHLWLGIPSGIILFVICLTGTIYTFSREITEWVDRDKFVISVDADAKPLPLKNLITSLEKQHRGLKVTGISIPEEQDKAWMFTLMPKDMAGKGEKVKDDKGKDAAKRPQGDKRKEGSKNVKEKDSKEAKPKKFDRSKIKNYLVNPYTGAVTGDAKTPSSKFFQTIMGLHRWLLLDTEIGRPITGISTLIFIVLEITGLILWLPGKIKSWSKWNAWKQGFKLKLSGGWKRINYDLHNTLGFYTLLLVTIMAITGLCFSFEWFREGVGTVLGSKVFPKEEPVLSTLVAGAKFDLDSAINKANSTFPYAGNLRINLPRDSTASLNLSKTTNGFFTSAGSDRILVDQYSGAVLKTDRFSDKKLGAQIAALIYPIHVGEIFGTSTKIIYFIICLIATSLPVTGTMVWINKFNKKPAKEKLKTPKKTASEKNVQRPVIMKQTPSINTNA